jgi:helix-turn-helix protein
MHIEEKERLPRDFKGIWIPKDIWLHKELSSDEMLLWAEIDSLDGEKGCFATNEYFMKFFNCKERVIQDRISRLKKLGFIFQESFDGRTRILRSSLKTIYEKFSTSEVRQDAQVHKTSPLGCEIVHPTPIYENKEENSVCIDPLSGSSPTKEKLRVFKKNFDGQEIEVSLQEIFKTAVFQKKSWTTQEIQEAWTILVEFQGPIREPMGFIEGAIRNMRQGNKHKWLNNNRSQTKSDDSKLTFSDKDTPELILRPLTSLLDTLETYPNG